MPMATNVTSLVGTEPRIVNRWVQMCACIIAMMAIANLQYAWTLFTKPLTSSLHATLAAVQIAFAAFIFCETWLVPFEGYLIDRLGPRLVIGIGGLLVGAGWIGSGYATTTTGLYIWYAIGGIGAGAVYGGCTGNVLKWFPDHRGLCAGIVSGAYGIGTAVTVAPIAKMIKVSGYQHTFIFWGILQGIIVFVAAMFIVAPAKGWLPKAWKPVARVHQTLHDMTGDAEAAIVLRHLRHDDVGSLRRPGGYRATDGDRRLLQSGQGHGGLRPVRGDPGHSTEPDRQRRDSASLGLDLRPHRTRERHVHRFPH